MTNLELIKAPELQGVETSKAQQIAKTFNPMAEMLAGFEEDFNSLVKDANEGITQDVTKRAKRLRLDIAQVRISADKAHKEAKAEIVRNGKAIDGVRNILKWAVVEKENALKEIENHFEEMERQRIEKLRAERVELLLPYDQDAHLRTLEHMQQDEFDALLEMKKRQHEEMLEAQRLAEIKRREEEEARRAEEARIKEENARLKAEAEAR